MGIPIIVGNNENSIIIQTRRGSDISNSQSPFISAMLMNSHHRLRDKFPRAIPRNDPSGFYNCHGLVFASRRAAISEPEEIRRILKHDCYLEVTNSDDVLPGDVVLYLSDDGDPEHSGIVTCAPSQQ